MQSSKAEDEVPGSRQLRHGHQCRQHLLFWGLGSFSQTVCAAMPSTSFDPLKQNHTRSYLYCSQPVHLHENTTHQRRERTPAEQTKSNPKSAGWPLASTSVTLSEDSDGARSLGGTGSLCLSQGHSDDSRGQKNSLWSTISLRISVQTEEGELA